MVITKRHLPQNLNSEFGWYGYEGLQDIISSVLIRTKTFCLKTMSITQGEKYNTDTLVRIGPVKGTFSFLTRKSLTGQSHENVFGNIGLIFVTTQCTEYVPGTEKASRKFTSKVPRTDPPLIP